LNYPFFISLIAFSARINRSCRESHFTPTKIQFHFYTVYTRIIRKARD